MCVCVVCVRAVGQCVECLLLDRHCLLFSLCYSVHFIYPCRQTCYSHIKVFRMITERNAIGNLRKIKFVALKSYSLQLVLAFDVFYYHFCLLISVDFCFLCLPVQVEM